MIGETISHYRILAKLGEGGMGVVYKATDTKLGRTIALKVLKPEYVGDEEYRRRFLREARSAAAVTHPYIAAVESQASLAITPELVLSRAHLQTTLHELWNLEEESMRRRVFHLYLAGILGVRLGDHAAALRHAAALDSIRSAQVEREGGGEEGGDGKDGKDGKDGEEELPSSWPLLVESLAHGVRAEVAWSLGKPAEALLEIEQTHPEEIWKSYVPDLMVSHTYQRFMRAMLLEKACRLEEALQWYSSLGQVSAQGYVYLAPKRLKMGEIYERLGEAEKAAEHYQRFVELWQDCDPEYRSTVDEVRARIARLEP